MNVMEIFSLWFEMGGIGDRGEGGIWEGKQCWYDN